jgi:hypothetical protein
MKAFTTTTYKNIEIKIYIMKNLDNTYTNQMKDLQITDLNITKVEFKKHSYKIECYINNRFSSFCFNSKLKKTTSCGLSSEDKRLFPNLGDNFIYIINQRISKDVNYELA